MLRIEHLDVHIGTIQILDGRHVERSRHFRAGNLLVSVRQLHRIVIDHPVPPVLTIPSLHAEDEMSHASVQRARSALGLG